ncbi:sulfotransferase family protein [Nocardioides coralli]|uniref:sulfotransferase family protein n=1 Tax=Nocardioides coralli TaxID=2872154 RepID=UPI001CA3D53C|nr:sulfotransferase [Nocardioides coralli]QZY28498.1 sulfotransferase [Nocardioides coralli]
MTRHFLVAGAQRCGTTWLHELLAGHPEIAMARPARPEPKVFLREDPPGADAYRAEFFGHVDGESLLGEKSTSYLESPEAPDRVAATLGSPQIVVQLRDPVARAVSNWSFSRDHGVETRPLAEALRADMAGQQEWDRAASSVSPFAYVTRGRYVADLARWTERFDVHVQFLEELVDDTDRVVGDLFTWLGVDAGVRPDTGGGPVNASSTAEPLDRALEAELRDHYRDSDDALADLLGRELPWRTRKDT